MTRRRSLIALLTVISLITGWQANEIVSARSAAQKVCLTASGTVTKKTSCASGETELAVGKVRSTPIKKRQMKRGLTRLSASEVLGRNQVAAQAAPSDVPLISTVASSIRAYTYALTFTPDWSGTIFTECAENEIPLDAYATYTIGGERISTEVKPGKWWHMSSILVNYEPLDGEQAKMLDLYFDVNYWKNPNHTARVTTITNAFDRGEPVPNPTSVNLVAFPSNFTLYLTQTCAPLSTLEGVG
jgi:hypothetical protein